MGFSFSNYSSGCLNTEETEWSKGWGGWAEAKCPRTRFLPSSPECRFNFKNMSGIISCSLRVWFDWLQRVKNVDFRSFGYPVDFGTMYPTISNLHPDPALVYAIWYSILRLVPPKWQSVAVALLKLFFFAPFSDFLNLFSGMLSNHDNLEVVYMQEQLTKLSKAQLMPPKNHTLFSPSNLKRRPWRFGQDHEGLFFFFFYLHGEL